MSSGQPAPGLGDYLKSLPLYVLPHHGLSRLMFALTRIRASWFKNTLIRWFAWQFQVDWSEARCRRPEDFPHFNAFFTRALKDGARPVDTDETAIICPADGHISQIGTLRDGRILQAKGRSFSATELLGGDRERARPFDKGSFATVYLSPRDYHRVHMPCSGRLLETVYVPGRLFSVAPHTTRTIPDLFARNERLVALFDTEFGRMALVMVGAIFVAGIETVWSGLLTPPHRRAIEVTDTASAGPTLARGEEMGRFNMGSTVIVLFEPGRIAWDPGLAADQPVKMGQRIGRALPPG